MVVSDEQAVSQTDFSPEEVVMRRLMIVIFIEGAFDVAVKEH